MFASRTVRGTIANRHCQFFEQGTNDCSDIEGRQGVLKLPWSSSEALPSGVGVRLPVQFMFKRIAC